MAIPIEVSFKNMAYSAAVESNIHSQAAGLGRFSDMIRHFRVTVLAPSGQHQQDEMYRVSIDISIPDAEIVVRHDPLLNHAHVDVFMAIRDAMNGALRQLEKYALQRRGELESGVRTSDLPGHLLE